MRRALLALCVAGLAATGCGGASLEDQVQGDLDANGYRATVVECSAMVDGRAACIVEDLLTELRREVLVLERGDGGVRVFD